MIRRIRCLLGRHAPVERAGIGFGVVYRWSCCDDCGRVFEILRGRN